MRVIEACIVSPNAFNVGTSLEDIILNDQLFVGLAKHLRGFTLPQVSDALSLFLRKPAGNGADPLHVALDTIPGIFLSKLIFSRAFEILDGREPADVDGYQQWSPTDQRFLERLKGRWLDLLYNTKDADSFFHVIVVVAYLGNKSQKEMLKNDLRTILVQLPPSDPQGSMLLHALS